jgi:hypothetical protein
MDTSVSLSAVRWIGRGVRTCGSGGGCGPAGLGGGVRTCGSGGV